MTLSWRVRDRCYVRGHIARVVALHRTPRAALVRTDGGDVLLVHTRDLDLVPFALSSGARTYTSSAMVA